MFSLSVARETDIPLITELAQKTWWPTYSQILSPDQIRYMLATIYSAETLQEQIRTKSQTYLLLRDDKTAVGFAAYGPREEEPATYKLHKIYVLPETQGKGYGRALITEITNRLRKKNIHTLDLNVNRQNPARRFYEKIGFVVLREEDIPIGPYWMNDYVMRLTF